MNPILKIYDHQDVRLRWHEDAPEPADVLSHVACLVAGGVNRLAREDLRTRDPSPTFDLILAADFYFTFYSDMTLAWMPDAALPAVDLHKRFATAALAVSADEPTAAAVSYLEALARDCFHARGHICETCGQAFCPAMTHDGPTSAS
jgi:hypothetical protein